MSSAGIDAINSGPLILRTYNNSSPNKTIVLGNYDNPVSSNYILITSTGGLLAPTDNINLSSINVSTIFAASTYINYAEISTLYASSIVTSSISSNIGWVGNLNISSLNGTAYVPGVNDLWSTISLTGNMYNINTGNVGIKTSNPTVDFQVNGNFSTLGNNILIGDTYIQGSTQIVGNFSTLGNNVLIGDTYIQGSTQITNYLSTNNIEMNSGLIENTGVLLISTTGITRFNGPNDGVAGIQLMNGKSRIVTNTTFDGMFLQVSSTAPNFFFTSLNDTQRYAILASTYHQFNNKVEVFAPSYISSYEHYLNITNAYPGPAYDKDVFSALTFTTTRGYYNWTLTNNQATSFTGRIQDHLQLWAYNFPSIGGSGNNNQILDIAPNGSTILWNSLHLSTTAAGAGNKGRLSGISTINDVVYPFPVNGEVPLGGIIMWSGNSVTLPTNWSLCDGGNYNGQQTPDLRGRFIMGATYANGTNRYTGMSTSNNTVDANGQTCPAFAVSTIGGEINHTLTIPEMPSHQHILSFYSSFSNCYQSGGCSGPAVVQTSVQGSTVTTFTGDNQSHNNMPQYYVLAYIMRTS